MSSEEQKSEQEKEIAELLKEALQIQLTSKKQKRKVESTECAINTMLGEFLDSYLIIGYDTAGEPFIMKYASKQMQSDALQTLSTRFLAFLTNYTY